MSETETFVRLQGEQPEKSDVRERASKLNFPFNEFDSGPQQGTASKLWDRQKRKWVLARGGGLM